MKKEFCYSMDGGEYYTGRYESRERALDAALQKCEGYHSEVHTAQIKDWPQFINSRRVGFQIAEYVNDCLDEDMLPEEMVLCLDDVQFAELGDLVVNWLQTNVKAAWYNTEDVQSQEVEKEMNKDE